MDENTRVFTMTRNVVVYFFLLVLLLSGCREQEGKTDAVKETNDQKSETAAKDVVVDKPLVGTADVSQVHNEVKDSLGLLKTFLTALEMNDTTTAANMLVSGKEYAALFPALPENDGNHNTLRLMTSMHIAGNKKHFFRWIGEFQEKKFKMDSVGWTPDTTLNYGEFSLIQSPRITIQKQDGLRYQVEIVNTLLKTPDGYKIWVVRDLDVGEAIQ